MRSTLTIYKPLGLTSLEAINRFRDIHPEYDGTTLSYAGRLDPMAEGLLLILVEDENKRRHEYEHMEKAYEFEVLFGVTSDSYDVLGFLTDQKTYDESLVERQVLEVIPTFLGDQMQPFPAYSSKPVLGKALYKWAREGRLNEITIPEKSISISSLDHLKKTFISKDDLRDTITQRILLVNGDFRQEETIKRWGDFLTSTKQQNLCVMKFLITCSSGTYVRSVARSMGEKIGIPSLAFSIKRIRVGEYTLDGCFAV